jgi:general secretion pathway protein F
MAQYAYQAVEGSGRTRRGTVEASSEAAARGRVRDLGLVPVKVSPVYQAATGSVRSATLARFRIARVSPKSLAAATRQLSTMISSGIRVEEAVRIVGAEHSNQPIGPILSDVAASILEGRSLAAALESHPVTFPEFYRASIAAGEQSGKLSEVLSHLTDFVSAREKTARKIQLALLYPALLAVVSTLMITLLMIYVVPDIVKVFVSRGAALPFLTRALIAVSNGLQAFGLPVLIVVGLAGLGLSRWLTVPAVARKVAQLRLTTPPFGAFVRQLNAGRFAASLATLVRSDVPLVEALKAAAAVTPNLYVRERALLVALRVREGASLRNAMTEADVFPRLLLAVVASGEQSGRLGQGLERAAADLDQETEALIAAIVALVEPAVLLVMGGLVLLMVLAILMPIVNLNTLAGL